MTRCDECKHAILGCEEYYYGTTMKQWFVERCEKDLDIDADECEEFERGEDDG